MKCRIYSINHLCPVAVEFGTSPQQVNRVSSPSNAPSTEHRVGFVGCPCGAAIKEYNELEVQCKVVRDPELHLELHF